MFTVKNPKSNSSFFGFSLIAVYDSFIHIGHIVRYERITYNRYGGSNSWECIQFVPLKGYEKYSLESEYSKFYKDISLYEDMPIKTWLHMGARDGEEERLFIVDGITPVNTLTLRNVSRKSDHWQKVVGCINLSWSGEDQDVVTDDLVISDEYILYKNAGGYTLVRKDEVKETYPLTSIWEKSLILNREDALKLLKSEESQVESSEAPTDDSEPVVIETEEYVEARPRRRRRSTCTE